MKLQIANDFNNSGPPPPISYNPYQNTRKTLTDKTDYLKIDINMHTGDKNRKTVAIYVQIFRTGSP